ncbi:MAG: hypothetical protein AB2L17_02755 [Lentimicrobium sp.]
MKKEKMTYREKNINAPPILTSTEFEADVIQSINNQHCVYSSVRYGHNHIREALAIIYGEKCAYCECKIEPASTAHIDHYRPVNPYATIVNPQHHLGYYWLAYEWTNLIQSCPSCNQAKSSKFHLEVPGNRQTYAPALVATVPNYNEHLINSQHLNAESPLLINPEIIDPDLHLFVNYFGLLEARNGSIQGEESIKICDLNRNSLYVERSKLIESFINQIEDEIYERYRDDEIASTEAQYKNRLNKIFKNIIAQQSIEMEYNMTARSIIERFDELILEDLERCFRREIRDYFVDFLNNL